MPPRIELPCDELQRLYGAGQSTSVLARRFHCSPTIVARELRRCAIGVRRARFQAVPIPEALLRMLYTDQHLPISEIGRMLGISPSTITNRRRAYGIPARPRRR